MPAKTWDADFRYAAIRASIRALGERYRTDPFLYPGSFCLPVDERPIVGWGPGRFMLVALVVGFPLLLAGGVIAKFGGRLALGESKMTVATWCSVTGMLVIVLPLVLYGAMVRWLLGERAGALLRRAPMAKSMTSELNDAAESAMRISIDGCDNVLVVFDEENRRLMIEGLGARYQIRAADVEEIAPFAFMNHVGVRIAYRIDADTRLRVVIARASMAAELRRRYGFGSLHKSARNRLLANAVRTLRAAEA
jgi:hypothetical protein